MPLTDTRLRALKPKDKPYKVTDERGLYVEVTPTGGKLWRFRYRIGGAQKKLCIGSYPDISLKQARDAAYEARRAVASGGDPAFEKRKRKIRAEFLSAQTFEAVAREYIEQMMVQNGRADGTIVKANYFLDKLAPAIGNRPIDEIEPFEVLAPLKRLEATGKHETAKKCRSFAGRVFRYGVATTRCKSDPTSMLKGALVTPRATHYAAILEPTELGGLLRAIDDFTGYMVTKLALQIAPHVFVRPGELRHAEWHEIDLVDGVWKIPAGKMKARRAHAVPLSKQVRGYLTDLAEMLGREGYVFPSARSSKRPMSENTLNAAFRRMGYSKEEVTAHGLYLPYRPSRIAFEDAPVHPTPLVESVAMGSVAAPQPDVCPRLPACWQADGLLSEAQCETLVYAAQAFARDLPGQFKVSQEGTSLELSEDGHSYRQGFFLGDGTGAGKGRQIAAVIMDRWLDGERRHVWITKNEALLEDARRDWEALGGLPLDLQPLSRWKLGHPVTMSEGILFVTYPTLRSGRAEDTRLDQILAWAGEDFDGVIAFDEAHAMANALGGSSIRGKVKGSEQGMAGLRLQNHLPRARVLYASATGASDIANLGYTSRLGLWGPETAFPTHEAFMTEIRAGGVAAMELVARDLKAQGLYLARALSFAGVEYEILEHSLTEAQVRIYDAYADAWAIIHRNLEASLEATRVVDEDSGDTLNRNAKAAALSIFEGTKQRFFAQLLLSMKLPSLIPAMEAALGEDHSVVVQLVSTAEAMLDRRLADLSVEEREALDIDLSPREYVIDYLVKSFPVRLMQVFADEDGNLRSEAMSDEEGNPIFCTRAVAARDALIEKLCALPPIATALDAIIEHFGTDAVAEVTGRTRRLVLGRDGQQRLERRSPSANVAEAQSFMEGTKRILVFSDAGGTGRSYHADLGARNQQRRVHFLLEPGWRVDIAIQGLGRTNRTNQASAPLFRPVTTDVKGERRFISTIARRLDALGALTRGQRQTGGQNLFDPADNLESDYARDALSRWFQLLYDGKLEATSFGNFVERTGLRLENPDGGLTDNLPTIQRWLNRILALPIALQNSIFDEYLGLVEARIEAAREAGTLDQGLETVKVDHFTVLADELLRTDPVTGAETRLVSVEVTRHLRPLRLQRLVRMHEIGSRHAIPMRNMRSGKVALSVPARRLIADDGAVIERRRLLRPLKSANWTLEALAESHWEEIGVTAFTSAWRTEEEEAAKSPVTERVHLATGLLLPVWKRLPGDHVRVTRLVAEDGQSIIGREVLDIDLAAIAETFGLSGVTGPAAEQIGDLVLASGKPLSLASHDPLTVKRSLVGGEQRLELTGFSPDRLDWYKGKGCFTEIIRYRTRLFVPVSEASSVLPALAA